MNEAAQKTGIDPSVMSRLLRGRTIPSVENMLRIAFATSTHPARLFELAGQTQLAFLCRGIDWDEEKRPRRETDLYPAPDAHLHRRLQRLLELGFVQKIEAALRQLETAWEMLRPAFEAFAEETSAKAALLIADTPLGQKDVLFALRCPEPDAQEIAERGERKGWHSYRHQ
ncbi:MAG: helix-turn-helix domain-containing protein, partial [Acidobacteriota bacterium]